jgi:hypothetical protein
MGIETVPFERDNLFGLLGIEQVVNMFVVQ